MSNVIPFEKSALPASLAAAFQAEGSKRLGGEMGAGFPVLSIRGSRWRVKWKGEERVITDPNTGDPVGSLRVVILDGNDHVSKIYYEKSYDEGDDASPDCFSLDGVTPDPTVQNPQSKTCEACPHNVYGSKVTPQGTLTWACANSVRLAVAPAGDIPNEAGGGSMLLRVPGSCIKDLQLYNKMFEQANVPFYGFVTILRFDTDASYPKITFTLDRDQHLTEEQAAQVLEARKSDQVRRILSESIDFKRTNDAVEHILDAAEKPQRKPEPQKTDPVVNVAPAESEPKQEPPPPAKAKEPMPSVAEAAPTTPSDVDSLVGDLLGG